MVLLSSVAFFSVLFAVSVVLLLLRCLYSEYLKDPGHSSGRRSADDIRLTPLDFSARSTDAFFLNSADKSHLPASAVQKHSHSGSGSDSGHDSALGAASGSSSLKQGTVGKWFADKIGSLASRTGAGAGKRYTEAGTGAVDTSSTSSSLSSEVDSRRRIAARRAAAAASSSSSSLPHTTPLSGSRSKVSQLLQRPVTQPYSPAPRPAQYPDVPSSGQLHNPGLVQYHDQVQSPGLGQHQGQSYGQVQGQSYGQGLYPGQGQYQPQSQVQYQGHSQGQGQGLSQALSRGAREPDDAAEQQQVPSYEYESLGAPLSAPAYYPASSEDPTKLMKQQRKRQHIQFAQQGTETRYCSRCAVVIKRLI